MANIKIKQEAEKPFLGAGGCGSRLGLDLFQRELQFSGISQTPQVLLHLKNKHTHTRHKSHNTSAQLVTSQSCILTVYLHKTIFYYNHDYNLVNIMRPLVIHKALLFLVMGHIYF